MCEIAGRQSGQTPSQVLRYFGAILSDFGPYLGRKTFLFFICIDGKRNFGVFHD